MIDRIITTTLFLAAAMAPAFAGTGVGNQLPEPAAVTLFGLGIGGAYLAKRLIGRK